MERRDRAAVATFFSPEPIEPGRTVALGEGEARHARVLRLGVGERVRLVDGSGGLAWGPLVRLTKTQGAVDVEAVDRLEPLPVIHLVLPVADRERMLLLAEKATEFGVASWRPVLWRRSRSVSPRGEGMTFQSKVRARMIGALTQSGGGYLPVLYPDATPERAVAACPPGERWLLDADGEPPSALSGGDPLTIAVGPEGGVEDAERAAFLEAGFRAVRLAPLTLRFETAAIAGLAIARAAELTTLERSRV